MANLSVSTTPPPVYPIEFSANIADPNIQEKILKRYTDPQFRDELYNLLCEASKTQLEFRIEYLKSQIDAAKDGSKAEVNARFPDLPCPRKTAVKVGDLFLHANYVCDVDGQRQFVASQLPTDKELFWRFVLNENYHIFDLYNGKSFYYPTTETPLVFNNIQVQLVETFNQTTDEYTHTYLVQDLSTKQEAIITRCHYTGWPTHAVVDVAVLDYLVNKLATFFTENTLVHCLAGYGRTGTVIAAYLFKQRLLKHPTIDAADLGPILQDLLVHLRAQRGLHFVESKEQYFLLLDYGIYLFRQRQNSLT